MGVISILFFCNLLHLFLPIESLNKRTSDTSNGDKFHIKKTSASLLSLGKIAMIKVSRGKHLTTTLGVHQCLLYLPLNPP